MLDHGELLSGVSLFSLLDEQERAILAERVELMKATKDEVVFRYGDPGDTMFVLVSGKVELSFKNKTGDKVVLQTVEAGDFFGEISLLDRGARTATATVLEDIEALVVDQGDLDELFRLKPQAAFDLLAATGKRLRQSAMLLRNTATRNVNDIVEDTRSRTMKIADWIADFSGSMPFLFLHVGIFAVWIILNVHILPFGNFDPFPFGLLTMVVSLEAIILSVFVLLSQNRQIERERVSSEIEYDVNLKAELQIQHLHEKFDQLNADVLQRFERLENFTMQRANTAEAPQSGGGTPKRS
ncbi:MAG: DUF1003 domain-containing protein [Polyangiaceae bacterium]